MFKYTCSKCDQAVTNSNTLSDKKDATRSLGTWRCKTHGKVAVKRTKQDAN